MSNQKFKVNLVTKGLSEAEESKAQAAARHFEKAMNSKEFYDLCHPFKKGGGTQKKRIRTSPIWRFWNRTYKTIEVQAPYYGEGFKLSEGRTDSEVYKHLLTGSETLDPIMDGEADVYLEIDDRNKTGVIGYTYANVKWQWIYNWAFKSFTVEEVAGNLSHEWCHKMGYGHARKNNATRKYTVPYAVGYFVRDFKGE